MKYLNDKYFWILLFFALTVRIYLVFFTYVIQNDSVAFLQNAQYFANGDFLNGLRHDYHPLYSLIMAGVHLIVPNMELSGVIISIVFGTFTVAIFYVIGREVLDQRVSFISSIILAFHPYAVRFSVDIISESTYYFFFVSALGLGFLAIKRGRLLLFALTGFSAALAYLTRPEGIGIILVVFCWCFFKDIAKLKTLWGRKLVSVFILVVSFLVFSSPYLVYIKKETGVWHLTKKKNLSEMVGVKTVDQPDNESHLPENDKYHLSPSFPKTSDLPIQSYREGQGSSGMVLNESLLHDSKGAVLKPNKASLNNGQSIKYKLVDSKADVEKRNVAEVLKQADDGRISLKTYMKTLLYIMNKYFDTFHPFLFIFLLIGVVSWRKIKKVDLFGVYITTIIVLYLLILYRLNIITQKSISEGLYGVIDQYPSRRHLMPIIIPALFCVGIGIDTVINWMHERLQGCKIRSGFRKLSEHKWMISLIVLMVIVGVLLPKTLQPQRYNKFGIKNAGQWLKENSSKTLPSVLSSTPRSAYYAGGMHIQLRSINNVILTAKAERADYILITHREYRAIGDELLQLAKDKQITLVYKYPKKPSSGDKSTFLYKVLY